MNSNSIFTRRHAGADAAASVSAPATTSAAAEDAFKNDPTATLEGVRGKDVTKAAKALLKDSVKRGGGSIQMRDVVKIYPGSTVHALDDFNLDIKPGEMVVLLGGSGCGKSTALRSLAGLEDIQGGRIMVGGQDVTGVPVNKREMAMVFQAYSLFPHMTALENVEFGLEVRGTGKAECRKIAMEQLELVGLADQPRSTRSRCPAVSNSAWPWPALWPSSRACSCSTSRSPRSPAEWRCDDRAVLFCFVTVRSSNGLSAMICVGRRRFLGDYRVPSHAGVGWHERQTMYIRAVPQIVLRNRCNDAISSCGVISHMWSGMGRREKNGQNRVPSHNNPAE